ncbi:hypothetical protein F4861DRAFT_401107 [Xylaria intraflava]|nr:hypothetical protein F4861DRAFT_401107 [Xylaria intraflava]
MRGMAMCEGEDSPWQLAGVSFSATSHSNRTVPDTISSAHLSVNRMRCMNTREGFWLVCPGSWTPVSGPNLVDQTRKKENKERKEREKKKTLGKLGEPLGNVCGQLANGHRRARATSQRRDALTPHAMMSWHCRWILKTHDAPWVRVPAASCGPSPAQRSLIPPARAREGACTGCIWANWPLCTATRTLTEKNKETRDTHTHTHIQCELEVSL